MKSHLRLRAVLQVAESGLNLEHIATFPVAVAEPSTPCSEARALMSEAGFDVLVLEEGDLLYRYVEAEDLDSDGQIGDCARTIDTRHLLPAALSLADALDALRRRPFYFVFRGRSIEGIVTRADIQRPPVGMLSFGLILAIEAGLNELILQTCGDDWPELLTDARRARGEEVLEMRRRSNADLALLDCVMLEDRICVLRKSAQMRSLLRFKSGEEVRGWGDTLKRLRDTLAHGGSMLDYVPDPHEALELVDQVRDFAHKVWDAVPAHGGDSATL